jgi:flagellar protein FliJ
MARFKFRLEPLLKIRRLEEDQAKRVVADRLRQIQQGQRNIDSLQEMLVEAGHVMRSLVLAGRIVPIEATRQRGYIGNLQGQLMAAQVQLQQLQAQLAVDRTALAEASKRCKVLTKLRERQQQRLIRSENLAEQRASDELGVLRFAHDRLAEQAVPAPNVGSSVGS